MGRTIDDIEIVDVEKRKIPSKHYVYILHVTWSDGSTNVIYRRYSRFFDFQSQLMDMFPEEAGAIDPANRIIPFLPGKKYFGRSHIREVAIKRLGPIAEYCKAIVKLPDRISKCKDVLDFFNLEPDDLNPQQGRKESQKAKKISKPKPLEVYIATTEYKKQEKGEVTLKVGMLVEVVEKTETGWWFVNVEDEQGWVPSTCLEREDGVKEDSTIRFTPGNEEQYLCTEMFNAEGEDEISLERGAVVDVIEKNLEGWWLVRYSGQEGYVPATFLMKTESFKIKKHEKNLRVSKPPVVRESCLGGGPQIVKNLKDVSDLLNEDNETTTTTGIPVPKTTRCDDDDDVFDDDYEMPDDEDIYSIQELSQILREDKKGHAETQKVFESIQNIKSRSLKRMGSTRPPPRPSLKPSRGGLTPTTPRPPLVHADSVTSSYITIASFSDAVGDGISFEAGCEVKVLEKSENGWWFIEIEDKEGWAPASYIERQETRAQAPSPAMAQAPSPVRVQAPSPAQSPAPVVQSISPSRSTDNLACGESQGVRHSAVDLANAIKAKLNANNPPAPPKKDYIEEGISNQDGSRGKTLPLTPPKKVQQVAENDSMSPSKSVPRISTQIPTPPKKDYDTDVSQSRPEAGKLKVPGGFLRQAQLQGKKNADRSSLTPPPPPPTDKNNQSSVADHSSEPRASLSCMLKPVEDGKGNPVFNIALKPVNKSGDTNTCGKPKPMLPGKPDTKQSTANTKPVLPGKVEIRPKPPVQIKPSDDFERTGNVGGLAGALKAKFEAINQIKSGGIEKNQPDVGVRPAPTTKPAMPSKVTGRPVSKPGLPQKPEGQRASNVSPWVKNNSDNDKNPEAGNEGVGASKVSDLASILKAKFENRKTQEETAIGNVPGQNLVPHKSGLKPSRPITPPSPKRNSPAPRVASDAGKQGMATSPLVSNSQLNPNKYSSRPLPPQPQSQNQTDERNSQAIKPVLPTKPGAKSAGAKHGTHGSAESDDSEEESRPAGVAGLANILKAKLAETSQGEKTKPKLPSNKPSVTEKSNEDLKTSIEHNNNNVKTSIETVLYAISDFAGSGEGEMRLFTGQQVHLLEKADGWWFVSDGHSEGWAPSSYLDPARPEEILEPAKQSGFKSGNSGQTVYQVSSDFNAENEGEVTVREGQEVKVLEAPDDGWWYVEVGGEEGWVPASYLQEVTR